MVEQLIPIGILIIFIGFVVIIAGVVLSILKQKQTKVEYGFGGFIGPIPFGFATRKEFLYLIIALSLILILVFLFLSRKF